MSTSELITEVPFSIDFYEKGLKNSVFQKAEIAIERYRKFLFLKKKYPSYKLVPTIDIDKCWHLHIEHPTSYHRDCMKIFGRILGHNSGFGKSRAERAEWKDRLNITASLWQDEFNESYKSKIFNRGKYCNSD